MPECMFYANANWHSRTDKHSDVFKDKMRSNRDRRRVLGMRLEPSCASLRHASRLPPLRRGGFDSLAASIKHTGQVFIALRARR